MALSWKWPLAGRRSRPDSADPIAPAPRRAPVSEYEDRYPDAYGHGEAFETPEAHRHYAGVGLPRSVRDDRPAVLEIGEDVPVTVVNIQEPDGVREAARPVPRPPLPRHHERPRRPLVDRTPREICDEVAAQLDASPFIDASGIAISVDGSEVTLEGTINSLIAISLAKALVSNIPGVSRVQVQLRVQPVAKVYETAGSPVYKIEE